LAKAKTSKPESSTTKVSATTPFDKLYWLRIGLGALGGFLAKTIFTPSLTQADYVDGALLGFIVYFASYYIARFAWYRHLEQANLSKLYTTGIGGFIMIFLFTWMLCFTLSL
jgi:hypothetical protein